MTTSQSNAGTSDRQTDTAAVAARVDPARALTFDFLRWIAGGTRTYREVMECWRTNCPRLSIWEDALDAGLVQSARDEQAGGQVVVTLTARGRALLEDGR